MIDIVNGIIILSTMKSAPQLPMNVASPTAKAREFLNAFDNNLELAQQALADVAAENVSQNADSYKVAEDAPVVIRLEDVSKTYKLGKQKVNALKEVSLTIQQGEFVAITGASGSGKSTLLQLIGGLDKPTKGLVSVDGKKLAKLSDRKLSIFRNKTVGFVFQFFYLQPFLRLQTNLEVPGMFARERRGVRVARTKELAVAVGLEDRLRHMPKELSGGQMQRAAIARALLNNPKVILADEPTGNLDSVNGRGIIDLFDKIRHDFGTTVIVVTHDAKVASRADREIVMKDGERLQV